MKNEINDDYIGITDDKTIMFYVFAGYTLLLAVMTAGVVLSAIIYGIYKLIF